MKPIKTTSVNPTHLKFHPVADVFPPMSAREYKELVDSMREHGQREPVWLDKDGLVVDGRHRVKACVKLEQFVDVATYQGDDPAAFAVDMNLNRRHLDESQRAMVAARLANLSAGRPGKNTPVEAVSQDAAAEKLNVSRSAVQRAKAVVSQGTPELQAAVDAGQVAVSTAADIATLPQDEQKTVDLSDKKAVLAAAKQIRQENADKKREKKLEIAEQIRKEPEPLPTGPFRVIAIDPPWKYDNRADDESHRGRAEYPDMTVDDICQLPVPDLAHKDCVLWLWTTNAFMSDAYDCLFEWGFTAKTILTWDKQILGLGDYLRNVTEHCILAVRGKPTLTLTNQTTLISEKRREHSRKPEAFYALVESLCPGSKLEMFARERREGWQAWGAEVGKFN